MFHVLLLIAQLLGPCPAASSRPAAGNLVGALVRRAEAEDSRADPADADRDAPRPASTPAAAAARRPAPTKSPSRGAAGSRGAPAADLAPTPETASRATPSRALSDPRAALRALRAAAPPFLRAHPAAVVGALGLVLGLLAGRRTGYNKGYDVGKHEYQRRFQYDILPHTGETPMVRSAGPRGAGAAANPHGAPPVPASSGGSTAEPAALLAGRYELLGEVGSGGMGVVYEGVDRTLGRRVAIKRLRAELKASPKERENFLREARIISHLSHPYIVSIHEVVETAGEIYLIFDYVDGKPLSAILSERRRLSLPECRRIFTFVCEAIAAAHRAHILHRDLKPSNIMVETGGYVKVMDFGVAREAKETITRVTKTDDIAGTPAYMSPEQHLGHCAKTSDIYALGVCLYEAMTGQLPFPGPDYLSQKERQKYPPPQFLAPDLPKETELLFAAVLSPDPKKRVADAAELLESIKSLPG